MNTLIKFTGLLAKALLAAREAAMEDQAREDNSCGSETDSWDTWEVGYPDEFGI